MLEILYTMYTMYSGEMKRTNCEGFPRYKYDIQSKLLFHFDFKWVSEWIILPLNYKV